MVHKDAQLHTKEMQIKIIEIPFFIYGINKNKFFNVVLGREQNRLSFAHSLLVRVDKISMEGKLETANKIQTCPLTQPILFLGNSSDRHTSAHVWKMCVQGSRRVLRRTAAIFDNKNCKFLYQSIELNNKLHSY